MSDDHPVLYVTDQFGQSRPWDGECLLCQRDALRSRLAAAEALLRLSQKSCGRELAESISAYFAPDSAPDAQEGT